MNDTWVSCSGEAAVCSAVLTTLHLQNSGLRGALPELRLPALEELLLDNNELTGGLEPLQGCTALYDLDCPSTSYRAPSSRSEAARSWRSSTSTATNYRATSSHSEAARRCATCVWQATC